MDQNMVNVRNNDTEKDERKKSSNSPKQMPGGEGSVEIKTIPDYGKIPSPPPSKEGERLEE